MFQNYHKNITVHTRPYGFTLNPYTLNPARRTASARPGARPTSACGEAATELAAGPGRTAAVHTALDAVRAWPRRTGERDGAAEGRRGQGRGWWQVAGWSGGGGAAAVAVAAAGTVASSGLSLRWVHLLILSLTHQKRNMLTIPTFSQP